LIKKLVNAENKYEAGKRKTAVASLKRFIKSVHGFVRSGDVPAAEGQQFIDGAGEIIDQIKTAKTPHN
jgi:hypothetical protein